MLLAIVLLKLQQHGAEGSSMRQQLEPLDLAGKIPSSSIGSGCRAISIREDGRLRVAAFRLLDVKRAEYLIGLG